MSINKIVNTNYFLIMIRSCAPNINEETNTHYTACLSIITIPVVCVDQNLSGLRVMHKQSSLHTSFGNFDITLPCLEPHRLERNQSCGYSVVYLQEIKKQSQNNPHSTLSKNILQNNVLAPRVPSILDMPLCRVDELTLQNYIAIKAHLTDSTEVPEIRNSFGISEYFHGLFNLMQ